MGEGLVLIRKAVPLDVVKCVQLLEEGYATGTVNGIYPPVVHADAIRGFLDSIADGAFWVADVDDKIVGIMMLDNADFFWNKSNVTLTNRHFFVSEQYRNRKIAENLIIKAQEFAKECGVNLIIGVQSLDKVAAKERFLKMRSMSYIGGSYLYNTKDEG
jgi:GNAT superfamily N-acetyltransferase